MYTCIFLLLNIFSSLTHFSPMFISIPYWKRQEIRRYRNGKFSWNRLDSSDQENTSFEILSSIKIPVYSSSSSPSFGICGCSNSSKKWRSFINISSVVNLFFAFRVSPVPRQQKWYKNINTSSTSAEDFRKRILC